MKKSILPLSLLSSATSPVVIRRDISIVANTKNNTCQSRVSNNGNIDLGVADAGGFIGDISAESYHPDGKKLIIIVQDYALQSTGNMLNQLYINFRVPSGAMATGLSQIFANEDNVGVKNAGVVIFFIQGSTNALNVLSVTGSSRSVYSVTSSALNNLSRKFSTRM